MTTISCLSSLIQMGSGVPQYLLRLMAQSRASVSQLWKRFSLITSGTQYVCVLFSSS